MPIDTLQNVRLRPGLCLEEQVEKIGAMLELAANRSGRFEQMRRQAIARVHERYNWDQLLDELFVRQEAEQQRVSRRWTPSRGVVAGKEAPGTLPEVTASADATEAAAGAPSGA